MLTFGQSSGDNPQFVLASDPRAPRVVRVISASAKHKHVGTRFVGYGGWVVPQKLLDKSRAGGGSAGGLGGVHTWEGTAHANEDSTKPQSKGPQGLCGDCSQLSVAFMRIHVLCRPHVSKKGTINESIFFEIFFICAL